jgi:hypothetical protein
MGNALPLEVRLQRRIDELIEIDDINNLNQDYLYRYLTLLFSICLFYGLGGLVYEYGWFSNHSEHEAAAMIEDHIPNPNHQQR